MKGPRTHPAVITISAEFGTEEETIGQAVADRLGVGFLDRGAVPQLVADRIGARASSAPIAEEPRPLTSRVAALLARAPVLSQSGPAHNLDIDIAKYRADIESLLVNLAASGAVIIGRASAVVLRSVPGVLHVRLRGDRETRIKRVQEAEGISLAEARALVDAHDRARDAYGLELYGADPADVDHYHLILDTTALDVPTCIELITTASHARSRAVNG